MFCVGCCSISVQLSDPSDYSGGVLEFPNATATTARGAAIVFPSYTMHKVHPVTRGRRSSLVRSTAQLSDCPAAQGLFDSIR